MRKTFAERSSSSKLKPVVEVTSPPPLLAQPTTATEPLPQACHSAPAQALAQHILLLLAGNASRAPARFADEMFKKVCLDRGEDATGATFGLHQPVLEPQVWAEAETLDPRGWVAAALPGE